MPYIKIFTTASIYYWPKSNKEIRRFLGWYLRRHLENHFKCFLKDDLGILLVSYRVGQNDEFYVSFRTAELTELSFILSD